MLLSSVLAIVLSYLNLSRLRPVMVPALEDFDLSLTEEVASSVVSFAFLDFLYPPLSGIISCAPIEPRVVSLLDRLSGTDLRQPASFIFLQRTGLG